MTPQERRYWRNRQRAIEKWKAEHPDPPEGMMFSPFDSEMGRLIPVSKLEDFCQNSLSLHDSRHPEQSYPEEYWDQDPSYHWRKKA